MMRVLAPFALAACLTLGVGSAQAQSWLPIARAEIADGVERGSYGTRVSRVTARFGLDLSVDERPSEVFGGSLLLDVARSSASVGLDLRYGHRSGGFVVEGMLVGFAFPETLLGVGAAMTYRFPLAGTVYLAVGPEVRVFFLGSDLAGPSPLVQGLLRGGIHVAL